MKKPAALLICLFMAANQLSAQCCRGAQHVSADSPGGAWRVEATSLTGTGVSHHGPYHYRFDFLSRSPDGGYAGESSFELKWDSNAHFGLELFVSPTGSGVAVEFPNQHLAYYTRAGQKIFDSGPSYPLVVTEDGHSVILCRAIPMRNSSGSWYVEDSRVFLPLGALVTKQLDEQVIWFLQLDDEQVEAASDDIQSCLRGLQSPEAAVREEARQGLIYYAHLSISPLKKELAGAGDEAHRARLEEVLVELRMWEDGAGPDSWRDLPLLLSLSCYPDALIRRRARERVVGLLHPSLRKHDLVEIFREAEWMEETLQWIRDHQKQLRWDPQQGSFVLPGSDE